MSGCKETLHIKERDNLTGYFTRRCNLPVTDTDRGLCADHVAERERLSGRLDNAAADLAEHRREQDEEWWA